MRNSSQVPRFGVWAPELGGLGLPDAGRAEPVFVPRGVELCWRDLEGAPRSRAGGSLRSRPRGAPGPKRGVSAAPQGGRRLLNTEEVFAVPGGGVALCRPWRPPPAFLGCRGGSPRSPAAGARCAPAARKGWEEAPQPLGGSVAAATSSPAPRSRTPARSGLCLRLGLALRPALRPRCRRPPGLRSIAASRLRPPPRAHLPARLAAPPSAPRAAAPLSVPLGARPAHAHSPGARPPSRRADPAARRGRRFSPRGGSSARRPLPAFRPRRVLAPVGRLARLPSRLSRSEPTRGRERG